MPKLKLKQNETKEIQEAIKPKRKNNKRKKQQGDQQPINRAILCSSPYFII